MKVVITGGTGLIGSALANVLAQAKHTVIVPTRAPERVNTPPANIQLVKWDGKTAQGWAQYVDGADAIVNLAGEPIAPMPWIGDRKEKIRASRVNAGHAIVEAIQQAKNKPRVVVQSSAIGIYGIHGDETLNENAPAANDFLADVCKDWEASTAAVEAMGVRRVIYRTGLVLSRKGGVLPLMSLPFQFFVGGKLGSGKQWMSWIHIDDEVATLEWLIRDEKARGIFNLTAPNPVRNQDFSKALGKALGRPSAIPVPGFAMKIPFGEMADLMLLNGQRVVPERMQQLGFQFGFPTIEEAFQDIYK